MTTAAKARALRRVVVTGGAGFLGSRLCAHLVADGVEVLCLDDLSSGRRSNLAPLDGDPLLEFVRCDVSEPLDLPGRVDAVLHLASPASPTDYLRRPVETLRAGSLGTLHGLELARRKDARFVLASTSEVYGDPAVHPQPETYWGNVNPVGPRGAYDEAKRFAEALATAYRTAHGVDTAIARIFNTYGPRMRPDDGRAIPTFIGQALTNRPLTVAGDGSQTRSICYVDDLVSGLVALTGSALAGPVNLGNPEEMRVLDLARRIIEITGSSSSVEFVPRPADDPARRRPDIGLAWRALGWVPRVSWREGLTRTVEWFSRTATSV